MTPVFVYGADLDAEDRAHWLAGTGPVRPAGTGLLLDRRLSFERFARSRGGGVLTLAVAPGHVVEGALLELPDDALAALDAKHDHPDAYLREAVTVVLPDGTCREAFAYDVPPARRHGHVAPPRAYLDIVRRGLAAHGLGAAAMEAAAQGRATRSAVPWMFVYGTLRQGGSNARLLAGLTRHPATCRGVLHDLGPYPGMALGEGRVVGELVPLDPARLAALDALEEARPFGAPGGMYRRTVIPVRLADGSAARAQAYVMEQGLEGAPVIASGDWMAKAG